MKHSEILYRLKKHREHYRVLPALAANELNSLISELEVQAQPFESVDVSARGKPRVVGSRAKTSKKTRSRSGR